MTILEQGALVFAVVILGIVLCAALGFVALHKGSHARGRFGAGRLAFDWSTTPSPTEPGDLAPDEPDEETSGGQSTQEDVPSQ